MEILGNGRLIVEGGDANEGRDYGLEGGGAGGIIQIISPEGNLSAGSLSLGHGTTRIICNPRRAKFDYHGYYYLQGISI